MNLKPTRISPLSKGWGSVESRRSYQCLTTLYADHNKIHYLQNDEIETSLDEEKILCFRAKRMLICRDDVDGVVDGIVSPCTSADSDTWGYFVDTVEE